MPPMGEPRRTAEDTAGLGPVMVGTQAAMLALVTIAIVGRLYGRIVTRSIGADDYCMLVAGLAMIASSIIVFYQVQHFNTGKHTWQVPKSSLAAASKRGSGVAIVLSKFFFSVATSLVRVSVLLFLRRLAPYQRLRKVIVIDICVNILFGLCCSATIFFRCVPVKVIFSSYRNRPPGSKCLNDMVLSYTICSVGVALDCITWLLPVLIVRKARVSKKERAQMVALLCLGALALLGAAYRLPATYRLYSTKDPLWDVVQLNIACALEITIGIVAASAPGMKSAVNAIQRKAGSRGSSIKSNMAFDGESPMVNTFMRNRMQGADAQRATESTIGLTTIESVHDHALSVETRSSEAELDEREQESLDHKHT